MPAPLLWLGAAVAGLYATNKANEGYLKSKSVVGCFPGESNFKVTPIDGAIVCCGIFGVLDHTGIWVDGKIIELNGNGLVRAISSERFLENRSGEEIYIACDDAFNVMASKSTVERCIANLYSYKEYDVISNNCHRFVAESVTGNACDITSFSDLNRYLSLFFNAAIHWNKLKTL
ncbi:hypothetical protein [Glaciecola sp. KUL10]|jgi:hypothetical protein|uniref:hypothetical protein n=1 Tax=Glaciecola sp. (strain KUL10) TaxID=2161813 RepID=UPI000D788376|nr:hypothetical protein [Glaciecola sp. KUL10]GBL03019.1 hypothetical protein KUL10_02960 [Glaciecola sp. KUL10]